MGVTFNIEVQMDQNDWIQVKNEKWIPAKDGELPFKSKRGRLLWYMTNLNTGRYAYLDMKTGVFLSHKKALELT